MKCQAHLLLSAISFLLIGGCHKPGEAGKSSISFAIEGYDRDTIRLYQLEPLGVSSIHMHEVILDGSGSGTMDVEFPDNSYVYVRIGDFVFSIIHNVGSELEIHARGTDLANTLEITGKNALPNNYLLAKQSIIRKYNRLDGVFFFQLDSIEFWDRISALNRETDSLNTWLASQWLDPELEALLILESQQQSNVLILNYALVKGYKDPKFNVEIPYDEKLYNSFSSSYFAVLALNYHRHLLGPTWEKSGASNNDSKANDFPEILYETIEALEIPGFAKDFYVSRMLLSYFGENLTSPALEDVHGQWLSKYPHSLFKNTISNAIHSMSSLAAGEQAPIIKGIDPHGNSFTIEDLEGKVIYIDVWATWCSGCVEKIPHMYTLQKEYKDHPRIVFMFVSVDKDLDKWRNYISDLPEALHINASNTTLYKDYMMGGIPHYILIDASGNIIQSNAPYPDSKEIIGLLRKTIK